MKNQTWAWVMGAIIFVMIAGIWVWQLPNIIKHASRGKDNGLAGIMSVFGEAKNSANDGLVKAQAQLDSNLKKVGQTIATQEVQAAAIQNLKNKIVAPVKK
jgi:hypothetical protein